MDKILFDIGSILSNTIRRFGTAKRLGQSRNLKERCFNQNIFGSLNHLIPIQYILTFGSAKHTKIDLTRRVDAIHRLRETRAMVTGYDFIFPLFQSFCFGMPIGGRDLKELFFNRRCDHVAQYVWASFAKSGEIMFKKFLYQNEDDVIRFIFKDIEGDDEARLSQLTLWVLECEANALAFSIEIDNQTLESSQMSIFDILSYLGRY